MIIFELVLSVPQREIFEFTLTTFTIFKLKRCIYVSNRKVVMTKIKMKILICLQTDDVSILELTKKLHLILAHSLLLPIYILL